MISRKVIYLSIGSIILAWLSYWYNFGYLNSYDISNKPEDWATLGNFMGGILSPVLTFITIVLLVNSLGLQKESNSQLQSEIEKNELFEKVRSFELRFFNMIDSQSVIFKDFNLEFKDSEDTKFKYSSAAVSELESIVIDIKDLGCSKAQIKEAIEAFDNNDDIYSVIRAFCTIIKSIDNKINNDNGFSYEDALDYYETLISFTDYALFRLVLMCSKYLDFQVLEFVRSDGFVSVINKVGAGVYLEGI